MKRSTYITWAELRVGIFVAIALFVFTLAVLTLGGRAGAFKDKYTLYTLMPSVSGLVAGAPVRLAGVNVGTVENVDFISAEDRDSIAATLLEIYGDSLRQRALVVRFTVLSEVQGKVTRSSRAKIGTVGLLGDKYLDVDVGDPTEPVLQDGDLILDLPPIDYEGLIQRAAEGVDNLVGSLEGAREVIARVNRGEGTLGRLLTDPALYEEFVQLSEQGSGLLTRIQSGEGALPALLNDPRLYDQLVQATQDLQELTTSVRAGEGSLGRMIRDPELYNELVSTVRDGQDLIAELQQGEGAMAKFISDPELYERLNSFVLQAQTLLEDLQRNPKKYINLKVF